MRVLVLLVLALVLAVPVHAGAQLCSPTTSRDAVAAGGFYVAPDPVHVAWIYQESNGIAGLQRADAGRDDTCQGAIRPDRLVF